MVRQAFVVLALASASLALTPRLARRAFVVGGGAAAASVAAAPARGADGGVPMDLGPLGLRNGGSGKLNSCPPAGIKRGCISTSKFETDFYARLRVGSNRC